MKKFRFKQENLYGDIFHANPKLKITPIASGLWLYGLPVFIGPNKVSQTLVDAKMISFQPHYYGTFDSSGLHSPSSVVQTVRDCQKIFDRGSVYNLKKGKEYELPELKICIAHSFGCIGALRACQQLTSITTLVLMGPALHYGKEEPNNFGLLDDGFSGLDMIKKCHPYTYRLAPNKQWDTLFKGKEIIPNSPNHNSLKKVYVVVGAEDSYFDIEILEKNTEKLVRAYCGANIDYEFVKIPNVGHSSADLVEVPGFFSLKKVLKGL